MIKAVIFDMDGVIVDSEPVYQKRRANFFKENHVEISKEMQVKLIGSNPRDMMAFLFPEDRKKQKKFQADYEIFKLNYKINYQELLNPSIKEVLKILKKRQLTVAVASSSTLSAVKEVLSVNQITSYFDLLVSGEEFERSKPDPKIYRETLKRMALNSDEAIAVEDSYYGIQAAKGAQIKVLGFDPTNQNGGVTKYADACLDDLKQVIEYL